MPAGKNKPAAKTPERELVITRIFDAPRELVWKAWTEPERLMHWWGPKGFTVHTCKVDLRPGGVFHYGMRAPDGSDIWGKFIYREIVAPERIVFIGSFSDEKGGVTRHPMSRPWASLPSIWQRCESPNRSLWDRGVADFVSPRV